MKKNASPTIARTILSTLAALIGVSLVALAIFPIDSQSASQRNRTKDRQSSSPSVTSAPALVTGQAPAPAALDPDPAIGYENFTAPGVLVPVTTTEAGQQVNSVEWMGRNAGEPSIGSNWATGVTFFKSGLESLFVTFDDSCPANGKTTAWVNRPAPTSVGLDSDPIAFTDRGYTDALGFHSRSFGGELTFLSPDTV